MGNATWAFTPKFRSYIYRKWIGVAELKFIKNLFKFVMPIDSNYKKFSSILFWHDVVISHRSLVLYSYLVKSLKIILMSKTFWLIWEYIFKYRSVLELLNIQYKFCDKGQKEGEIDFLKESSSLLRCLYFICLMLIVPLL